MHRHFRKEMFVGFGVIIGSIIVLGLGIFFLSRDVSYQSSKIAENRQTVARKAASLGSLADFKNNAPKAATYRQAIDQILVTKDQLLDFPKWLDGLARGRSLSLSFSFSGSESAAKENSPGSIPFTMDVSGDLDNLNNFLKDIESDVPKFLTSINGFDLSGSGSSYRMQVGGDVYFR